jgi:hypothetical protein
MRRLGLVAVLLLASCLAPKGEGDAGVAPDGNASAACLAAGGECVAPGSECLEVVSLSISCGNHGTICCTVETAAVTTGHAAPVAVAPASSSGGDAGGSGCSVSCEMTCEGDPNCIELCGC